VQALLAPLPGVPGKRSRKAGKRSTRA